MPIDEYGTALALGFITATDLLGVLTNAFLGGMAARTARLDIVGFVVVAMASGLGGGMMRDMLLSRGPALVLTDPLYLTVAVSGAVVAYLVPFRGKWTLRLFILLDALSVGCWSAVGVQKGLAAGLHWAPSILLGLVTAVGGGMVRDLLLGRRPAVLGGNTLYATGSFVATIFAVMFTMLGFPIVAGVLAILAGSSIVVAARRYRWILPVVRADDPTAPGDAPAGPDAAEGHAPG